MKKLIACAAAVASLSCFAEDTSSTTLTIMGAGGTSCGTYVKFKEDKTVVGTRLMVTWAQGYLTAVNAIRIQDGKPQQRTVDANSIEAYLEKDCKEHLLDHVYQAVMRLNTELADAR